MVAVRNAASRAFVWLTETLGEQAAKPFVDCLSRQHMSKLKEVKEINSFKKDSPKTPLASPSKPIPRPTYIRVCLLFLLSLLLFSFIRSCLSSSFVLFFFSVFLPTFYLVTVQQITPPHSKSVSHSAVLRYLFLSFFLIIFFLFSRILHARILINFI